MPSDNKPAMRNRPAEDPALPSMPDPVVSVPLSQYDKLRTAVRDTQARVYELEEQLTAAQLADNSGTTKLLLDTFHATMRVVQFAVGNLEPTTIAGWPHQALVEIADALEKIPGVDRHIGEMVLPLREFAKRAAGYEAFRKERDANRVVTMAGAADFGPKTPEAAAVHAYRTSEYQNAMPAEPDDDKSSAIP
jgi:hypothetical protein